MALKDFFSFLRPKETVRYSSATTTNRFEIKDNKLTHNGASQTFDLAAGMTDALAGQLAQMGLSASDLQNLVHLSQQAPSHPNAVLKFSSQRSLRRFSGSPQRVGDELSASGLVSQDALQQILKSGKSTHTSRVTITVNGQQHTYDTTTGISAELRDQLAKQMGVSASELATLLKLPQHSLQAGAAGADCVEPQSDEDPQVKPR